MAELLLKVKFMKFKKIIIIALIIVIICVAGIYIYENMKPLTINDYFDLDQQYKESWNESAKEFTVMKLFPLKFNQTWENITTNVDFYKDSELIKSVECTNSSENGNLVVYTSVKLHEKPDDVKFDMIDGELIESDINAIRYAENRNWILNLI